MYFASGSYDCTARLWSVERTYPLRTYAGHKLAVQSVAFHDNANYLATADNTVRLWDVHSGETVRLMTGHWVSSVEFAVILVAICQTPLSCEVFPLPATVSVVVVLIKQLVRERLIMENTPC